LTNHDVPKYLEQHNDIMIVSYKSSL